MKTIGFVGAGNMARALGGGLAGEAGASGFRLVAADPVADALTAFTEATGGETAADLAALCAVSDIVVLAVKPQVLAGVLEELRPSIGGQHLVVSIVAGASLDTLSRSLGDHPRVIRAMPNTPALVGEGMTVLVGASGVGVEDLEVVREVFARVGRATCVEEEALLDAVTAVSGSGPGFLFAYAEAALDAARGAGLSDPLASELVEQTIFGSAALWRGSSEGPGELRRRVTSPGGTTQAGLEALEANGFARAVRAAVDAAAKRSKELSGG
jgi:pyrroline-5-carboxylate reductase